MNRSTLARLLFLLLFLTCFSGAQAATSLAISPSGALPYVNNVRVTVTARFDQGWAAAINRLERFTVRFNGEDISARFLDVAKLEYPDPQTVRATVEYLFGPGSYTVSAAIKIQGETEVQAQTTFGVPGDDQERRKNSTLSQISQFIHQYDHRTFHSWVSLGNINVLRTRLFEAPVQIYIDKSFNDDAGAVAQYVELYVWKYVWTVYDQDIVLSAEPEAFTVGGSNDSQTLWHETIHAVSHGLQLAGSPSRLTADDHVYLYWAESCIYGLYYLGQFEDQVAQGGLSDPPDDIARTARNKWKAFVAKCNDSIDRLPTAAEKAEFKGLIGFDIDPLLIKERYLDLGYPAEYFDDLKVTLETPDPAETTETTIDLTGSYERLEGGSVSDSEITRAYFRVNGSEQAAASFSGGTITGSVGLSQGDNRIQVVLVLAAGGEVMSNTVVVKSTNAVPITITLSWNRPGADVDLHLKNSQGSDCYYQNMSPDWGVAGNSLDDPQLDRDCINGCTIEHINIRSLIPGETYSVVVHYYSDHDLGSATAFVSVVVNGQLVHSSSSTLSDGQYWSVFSYTHH